MPLNLRQIKPQNRTPMKRIFTLLVILSGLLLPLTAVHADDGEEPKERIPLPGNAPRPKDTTAAEDNVTCTYCNGQLTFEFAEPEGRASLAVTRLEDGAVATASFMTWSPYTFTVGTEPGTYQISLSTSRDRYHGIFSID